MTRFTKTPIVARPDAVNLAGGLAYQEGPKLEFASLLLTSFLKDQFYRDEGGALTRLRELLDNGLPALFAAKAAIYARDRFHMRSITHVTAGEVAKRVHGETWVRPFVRSVVMRPDDITEIAGYYLTNYGKPLPHALRRGLRDAFGKFTPYQLAKYRGEGHGLKLVDMVNLLHPKPSEENSDALTRLVKGELRSEDTWERDLSDAGSDEELKAAAWKELIDTGKIGYFALLRNLRNILQQAPEAVPAACALLIDESRIKKSRVLPFRFATAYEQIEQESGPLARQVLVAINDAADKALAAVPKFEGETLVAVDGSGSMRGQPYQIASLFAAVLAKANNADLILFHQRAWYVNINPSDSVLSIQRAIGSRFEGCGTNFHCVFEAANRKYTRIIFLSDFQGWIDGGAPVEAHNQYRGKYGDPTIFTFDLAGLGTLMFPENKVYCLAGFSEAVFEVMKLLEEGDKQALVNAIEAIPLA